MILKKKLELAYDYYVYVFYLDVMLSITFNVVFC